MKYISVAVPCYNSSAYMKNCLDSLLCAKDDIEIIIINDGSSDSTGEIADNYASLYPDTVKVVHQINSGHGEGVNRGLENSHGLYFKVVDSDDWVNEDAFLKLIDQIKKHHNANTSPDMYVCNYVYEHSSDNSTYVMNYRNVFEKEKILTWSESKKFRATQVLMMHSVFFRTDFLKSKHIALPKHTFFVDNLFMFRPLPYVKSIFYLDLDIYRYFIGREDQSVNEKMMIKRIDQQIKVSELMIKCHDFKKIYSENPVLFKYLIHNLGIMMLINASFSFLSGEKEKIDKFYELWKSVKNNNPFLYKRLKYHSVAFFTFLPGSAGRKIFCTGYRFFKRNVKFG